MRDRGGFTLIELIVSFALIGIIAVSMFGAFDSSLLNISRAGSRTINTSAAENSILTNPQPISVEETVNIELPVASDGTTSIIGIVGSHGKGTGDTDSSSYGNTPVEIEAFIPGLAGL